MNPYFENIPKELKAVNQWVCWKQVPRGNKKPDKLPIDPNTGKAASSTDPNTWASFEKAVNYFEHQKGLAGIGFVFTEKDPFAGVDLDNCRNPETGELTKKATDILNRLNSYSEISPSSTGAKVFLKGRLPGKGVDKDGVEIYDRGRFFTVTGRWIGDYSGDIEDRQKEILALYMQLAGNGNRPGLSNPRGWQDEALQGVGNGSRHRTALRLAGRWATKGLSDAEIVNSIIAWNERNNPPKPSLADRGSKELQDILAFVRGKQPFEIQLEVTDLRYARRFIEEHGQDLRFCHKWGRWLIWDGKRWTLDETEQIKQFVRRTIQKSIEIASTIEDDAQRHDFLKKTMKLESKNRISSMLELARSETGVPITPEDLDNHLFLFNCDNGTINFKGDYSVDFEVHDRSQYLTKLSPYAYDPQANCPKWKEHLNLIMDGDSDLIHFLQRAWGSCLTGDTRDRKLFILYGEGANGKSVSLDTIQTVLGDYAMRTPTETLLVKRGESIPNDIARLKGARFVFCSEVGDGKRMAESLVKDLTGGEKAVARFLHQEWFEFRPEFKIFLSTNHKPIIRGTDNAIWDRICLIPFTLRISEGQRRPREELLVEFEKEGAGILGWLVQGCFEWLHDGLNPPDKVKGAVSAYRHEMDLLAGFIEEKCMESPELETTSADLYKAYETWARDNGLKVVSQIALGKKLREKGFEPTRTASGIRGWRGVGLVLYNGS